MSLPLRGEVVCGAREVVKRQTQHDNPPRHAARSCCLVRFSCLRISR